MTHIDRLQRQGILRKGSPRSGFRYVYASTGRPARGQLQRIRALRVPPAWRDVAINASARGRLQAIGRDAAGRWQYVYHAAHVRVREQKKFVRLLHFGESLPQLRRAVARDLRSPLLSRERVLATIVRILACAFIRPGSEVYAAENGSFGLATIRRKHVRVVADTVHFDFAGKSGKRQQCSVRDRGVAQVVRRLLTVPGYELFKFVNEQGAVVDVKRADINDYIKSHMGDAFSAKDFRTWSATLICACTLAQAPADDANARARKKEVVAAIRATAAQLGNTPAICRSSYISPGVLSAYEGGRVVDRCFRSVEDLIARRRHGLHPSEKALLRLLRRNSHGGAETRRNPSD
jgi:DNA topoisomerase-1